GSGKASRRTARRASSADALSASTFTQAKQTARCFSKNVFSRSVRTLSKDSLAILLNLWQPKTLAFIPRPPQSKDDGTAPELYAVSIARYPPARASLLQPLRS